MKTGESDEQVEAEIELLEHVEPVGYLRIDGGPPNVGGLYWSVMHKPKRRHLWAMWLVFGWRFCEKPELGDIGQLNDGE